MKKLLSTLVIAGALGAGGLALAHEQGEQRGDDDAAKQAKVTAAAVPLSTAVAEAEKAAGGKAAEADVDDEGGANWEIAVLTAAGEKSVMVDMATGQVVKIAAADEGEDGDDKE